MQLDGHFGSFQSSGVIHSVQQYDYCATAHLYFFTIRHQKEIPTQFAIFLLPPNFFKEASCFHLIMQWTPLQLTIIYTVAERNTSAISRPDAWLSRGSQMA